jgi:exodeoxyribonuclease VII small subunit
METAPAAKSPQDMRFEEALAALEGIVRDLESGAAPLEDAIAAYERGVALKARCEAALADARARIEKISVGPDGQVRAEPLDDA